MNVKSKTPRFAGLLRARSAGLEPATFSVRSHSPSQTGRYSGGQGETKPRFYRKLTLLKGQGGTGRDTGLWYRYGTKGSLTYSIGGGGRVDTAYEDHRILSPIRIVRDSALRSAFMSLFAFVGGMVRVRVRPDCHQSGHQNHRPETG